jgi:hypothetical protein
MLITAHATWLAVLGPSGFWAALQQWQALIGAVAAVAAVLIALRNMTTRTLRQNEQMEEQRRSRKRAAVRAVLPVALAEVSAYSERSARGLRALLDRCNDARLPKDTAPEGLVAPLPTHAFKILADFIEYSDTLDVSIVQSTIALLQLHDSRLRRLVQNNRDPSSEISVGEIDLVNGIIDAAAVYAGAGAVYGYARRRETELPRKLPWNAVRNALRTFWTEEHPAVYDTVKRREDRSAGPFEDHDL